MQDPLGYEGAHVVVTGAASGMGRAVAQILLDLGADVTALDIKDPDVAAGTKVHVDLSDRESIDAAVEQIDGSVDSVFSCAGLPGPPFAELDVMLVNFVGARHLVESLVPRLRPGSSIGVVSSAAAFGWEGNIPTLLPLVEADTFEAQRQWLVDHEDVWGFSGYWSSKNALDIWVSWRAPDLIERGIRLNCINPGPTDTAMMPAFHDYATKEVVDSSVGPIARYSTAEEQAWPLVLLNSKRMSYVCGEVLWTDGGFHAAKTVGRDDATGNVG